VTQPTAFVLPVDKPVGKTSHDVVYRVRRALGVKKVGHTGTLDPFATGLLLICVGGTTRLAEYLTGMPKCYDAVARLGVTTDTEDRTGEEVETRGGAEDLSDAQIEEVLSRFRGVIDQVPPQYSAKKVDGEAMHRRARRGEHRELAPRRIEIAELSRTEASLPDLAFRVCCSTGTYVRSLARDIGEALEVGGHLTSLRRISVGDFSVAPALTLDDLEDPVRVREAAITPIQALAHLPRLELDEAEVRRVRNGQDVPREVLPEVEEGGVLALIHAGALVAIGQTTDTGVVPRKVLAS